MHRSVFDDLLHEGKSFHRRAFDHVDNDDAHDALLQLSALHVALHLAHGLSGDCAAHRVTDQNDGAVWVLLVNVGEHLECVVDQRFLAHVCLFVAAVVLSVPPPVKGQEGPRLLKLLSQRSEGHG